MHTLYTIPMKNCLLESHLTYSCLAAKRWQVVQLSPANTQGCTMDLLGLLAHPPFLDVFFPMAPRTILDGNSGVPCLIAGGYPILLSPEGLDKITEDHPFTNYTN